MSYALARARGQILSLLTSQNLELAESEIREAAPGHEADLAVPLFRLARELSQDPALLARSIVSQLSLEGTMFASVRAEGGYLNFRFRPEALCQEVVSDFSRNPEGYGRSEVGRGRTIVIDFSSPNIAKPFSVGHLRSTIIGQALHNIFSWLGYRVIGDNHLGDWGTQFGKLLCAYELWGSEAELNRNPTSHLLELYVRFHQEADAEGGTRKAEGGMSLEARAREWFRRLEQGDPAARSRWEQFVALSTREFNRIYELLGVRFDVTLGESFYSDRLEGVVRRALERGVARREKPLAAARGSDEDVRPDETVVLIPLDEQGIAVPLILQKSDGTSLYATRELATAEYRIETWHPERILYVVGKEQEFYFRQFSAAMKLLGHDVPCIHVSFGLIRLPQGRISTRQGRVILLEDVINEAISRAAAVVTDRELSAEEKAEISRKVGIGAIKYADLSQSRIKEVVFDWDRMLSLDGDSAPYLQYAYTRTRAILRKAGTTQPPAPPTAWPQLTSEELPLLKHIAAFPDSIVAAAESYEPHRIANRLYRLAQDFSLFYDRVPVLRAETPQLRSARLYLVEMVGTVLRLGLGLLGIEVAERM
ncbi:MAG: arginine--tRNA ligase [candidate division WOR-3 bacterium]